MGGSFFSSAAPSGMLNSRLHELEPSLLVAMPTASTSVFSIPISFGRCTGMRRVVGRENKEVIKMRSMSRQFAPL